MRDESRPKFYPVRHACKVLGVSYPTLKQWIYKGKIKTMKTRGAHHHIRETEIDRPPPPIPRSTPVPTRRQNLKKTSGRNQLGGRIVDLKTEALMAQVPLSIAEQPPT